MDPSAPETFETQVAGLAVRGQRAGQGPPVVVLHHSFGSAGWLPFYEALAGDHAVSVPDLPGYGRSDRPDWARTPRDLSILLSRWLAREQLGRVHLVGLGFGGWLAAELACMNAEALASLTLVGAAGLLPREGRILDQFLISHVDYLQAAFSSPAAYRRAFGDELPDERLFQWDANREMTARIGWKPYMLNRRLAPLLEEVRVPALVVWGEADRVVPSCCAEQYALALPHARLETIAGCGHAVDLEQPETLAALVRDHVKGAR